MVSRELDFGNLAINDNNLQNYLESNNPSYRVLRDVYNQLIKEKVNPLKNQGLHTDKLSFIIIILEKILRNTEIIFDQNETLKGKITYIERQLEELKHKSLDPITEAGNKITEELKLFEIGFQNWNTKFDSFEKTFDSWNTGFKSFEENFGNLEGYLKKYSDFWNEKLVGIEITLKKLELNINLWNSSIINVNNNISKIENNLDIFRNKEPIITTVLTSQKQIFRKQQDINHNFTF